MALQSRHCISDNWWFNSVRLLFRVLLRVFLLLEAFEQAQVFGTVDDLVVVVCRFVIDTAHHAVEGVIAQLLWFHWVLVLDLDPIRELFRSNHLPMDI